MIKLFRFLKPYRVAIGFDVVFTFIYVMASLYLPTLMADIINNGVLKFKNGVLSPDQGYIIHIGVIMLLITAGGTICSIIAGYLASISAVGFGRDLRRNIFTHVEGFSLHEFDTLGTATLINRATNDVTQIQMFTVMMLRLFIMAPIMCVGGIIMALSKNVELSWVLVAAMPFLIGLIFWVATKAIPLFTVMQKKLDRLNRVLRESLTGVRVVRAFNRDDYEKERFDVANLDLTTTGIRVNRLMAIMQPAMTLIISFTSVAIIWFGSHLVASNTNPMPVGNLLAFLQYAMQIMFSLLMASMMFIILPRASASATRVNEVLNTQPEIVDPAKPKEPVKNQRGYIEFRDVTFSYPGAEQPAISNISFSAKPGEVTAIIGGTGSGKSTLIKLIPRFYDVDSGAILIDGVDIRQMSQATLRSKIGLVPQQAMLFSGSIGDNIRFGKETATQDDVERAATVSQALDFIQEREDGFDAVITQSGSNVSGGQKQRLSIARALVRHPEICMFDDSFSALDFKTDARLRAALKSETQDSTVLIVGQRVATVMNADRIIVLDDGRVAGIGAHRELLRTCEVYREIVASQLSEEEVA